MNRGSAATAATDGTSGPASRGMRYLRSVERGRDVDACRCCRLLHRELPGVARHHELRGRALVRVADAAGEPTGPDDRAGVAVCVDAVRSRAAFVRGLRGTRRGLEEVLERGQPGDRLRLVEGALPLAADLL